MKFISFIWIFIGFFAYSVFAQQSPMGQLTVLVDCMNRDCPVVEVNGNVAPIQSMKPLFMDLNIGVHKIHFSKKAADKKIDIIIEENQQTQLLVESIKDNFSIQYFEPAILNENKKNEASNIAVSGSVRHGDSNKPIYNAQILVKGTDVRSFTNIKGQFETKLPVGHYDLIVLHSDFELSKAKLRVAKNKKNKIAAIKMTPKGLKMEEYVVLAPQKAGSVKALLAVKRKSQSVAEVLGEEQISKAGDSDAASSLKRVAGLSVVGGKYVYVRGLGERYSNTLFNGVALPSPDPSRRVVPLDLFPADVIESLIVQKSYSVNRTGEFGGGTILLNSKSIPSENFLKLGVSQNMYTSFDLPGFKYQGGATDWLGVDDGTRALPKGLAFGKPSPISRLNNFKNHHNLEGIQVNQVPNLSMSFGVSSKIKKWRLGAVGSLIYKNKNKIKEQDKFVYSINGKKELNLDSSFNRLKHENNINTGVTLGLSAKRSKLHEIKATSFLLRKTSNDVSVKNGQNEEDLVIRDTLLDWTERQLKSFLLQGSHYLSRKKKHKIFWNFSNSEAERNEPDERFYRYVKEDSGDYEFYGFKRSDAYQRKFALLTEKASTYEVGVESKLPVILGVQPFMQVGLSYRNRDRESSTKRFSLNYYGADLDQYGVKKNDDLETIVNKCLAEDCFRYQDDTRSTDNYKADQEVRSYYLNTRFDPTEKLNVNIGWRVENSVQSIESFALFRPDLQPIVSKLTTDNVLPSMSATWKFMKQNQLRVAYSETVSRPDFKELSDTLWKDDELDIDVKGNPFLQATVIKNYDVRWEWYNKFKKDSFSLGAFYKSFQNPIEEVFNGASDPVLTFDNAKEANNIGLEIDVSKELADYAQFLNGFTLFTNVTLIDSKIALDNLKQSVLTSSERALQGQSPYMFNVMLDYENELSKYNVSLLYNVIGRRITQVGTYDFPDVFEESFHQVDVVFGKKLANNFKLKVKLSNVLDSEKVLTQGNKKVSRYYSGQSVGMSVSKRF